jgi:isopenicillin-N epimerase
MNRRHALGRLAFGAALLAGPAREPLAQAPTLPAADLLHRDPEAYWSRLRQDQFLLPNDRLFLNNGSLGVTPKPVLRAMTDYLERAAALEMDDAPRWGYETLDAEREEMAEFLGCRKDELAFTHNCTEAMCTIANGLDLQAGDEVILTNQEHAGGTMCWRVQEKRRGIRVRLIEIPVTPRDPGEITDQLISAIGPRTRVLSFSGITTTTGLILPVKQICAAAREKGVISVVDGAHMNGQIPVNLRGLGCDYFAGSPHKWMFAPAGCGFLYGRDGALDRLWPSIVSSRWDDKEQLRAARFMMVGTNNRAIFEGMMAGLRFLKQLGEATICARLQHLASMTIRLAKQRDYLDLISSDDPRFYQAMAKIRFKTENVQPALDALKKHKIVFLGGREIRLSAHVHTRPSDLEKFFAICDRAIRGSTG